MFQNIPKEKILDIVKLGPTLPAKIAKQVGADTMIVGAILSTLISTGDIHVSNLKVGSSPLYYIPGHESKLEDFIVNLNPKDKNTFRTLKEQKILQDNTQDPLIRVSLRAIKDFAKSFEVDYQGNKILFWRFYSVLLQEANALAISLLHSLKVEESKVEVAQTSVIDKIAKRIEITENLGDIKNVEAVEVDKKIESNVSSNNAQINSAISSESEHDHDAKKVTIVDHKIKKEKSEKSRKDFFEIIKEHIASKNLDIVSKEKIKKSEYNLILKNHDTNEYIYCKAKDKSSINEGDLAPALIFAQNKKMACLFISTGNLSKKAENSFQKEFSGMTFEKIRL